MNEIGNPIQNAGTNSASIFKLVIIPQIDLNSFNKILLPTPDSSNCGGYMTLNEKGQTIYAYSPIDIVVAAVESLYRNDEIDGYVLSIYTIFKNYKYRWAEDKLVLGITKDSILYIETISTWKAICTGGNFSGLIPILKKNAPLTFSNL